MKIVIYLCSLIILAGCAGSPTNTTFNSSKANKSAIVAIGQNMNVHKTITPYKLNKDYTVIDTGKFSNDEIYGSYAIIRDNSGAVDTIDKCSGIKEINKGIYFYETLKKVPIDGEETGSNRMLGLTLSDYFLVTDKKKIPLKLIVPDLDNYFSSPSIIDKCIYYWQIKKADSAYLYRVSAAVYNPFNKSIKNVFLKTDGIGTDDAGYFCPPYLKNDTIYFDQEKNLKKFSKDFKPYN